MTCLHGDYFRVGPQDYYLGLRLKEVSTVRPSVLLSWVYRRAARSIPPVLDKERYKNRQVFEVDTFV